MQLSLKVLASKEKVIWSEHYHYVLAPPLGRETVVEQDARHMFQNQPMAWPIEISQKVT